MSGFTTKTTVPRVAPPDLTKHVNYTLGMVLGVDEFIQEFAYLAGRDQWLTRDVLGYGTVCGLRIGIEADARGPQVAVAPGVAITPRGQLVRVPTAQCALLNHWLALEKTKTDLLTYLGSPPLDMLTLYVVLCYRECPTDMVPIPGEPCRTEEETMAASRVKDEFKLELRFTPPDQREEDALRDFVAWLKLVDISDTPDSFATLQEFEEAIRAAARFLSSPPSSPPDFMFGSPPASLRIPAAEACTYLRAAFRVWVTELRPLWLEKGQQCGTPPDEDCLLLAELNVPLVQVALTGAWQVDDNRSIVINEERRPYLLHLRFLQEWLLCGRLGVGGAGGGAVVTPGNTVTAETAFGGLSDAGIAAEYSRADHTHGTPAQPPASIPADTVADETTFGLTSNAGTALEYSRADHTHGTPPLPPSAVSPTPATTIVVETTPGQAAAVGVSLAYSRADHTHGTPSLPLIPTPANTVVSETTFGGTPNAGAAATYSRSDHTHGTPPVPAAAGDFVAHPATAGPYAIVAAGVVRRNAPSRTPIYNKLEVIGVGTGALFVRFDGYIPPKEADEFQYIIKVLPVFQRELGSPILVNFDRYQPEAFILHVTTIQGVPVKEDQLASLEFMIEVSQYPFKP